MSCICGECYVCERDQERAFRINYMNGLYGRPQTVPLDGNGDWNILLVQSAAGWIAGDGSRRYRDTEDDTHPSTIAPARLLRTAS